MGQRVLERLGNMGFMVAPETAPAIEPVAPAIPAAQRKLPTFEEQKKFALQQGHENQAHYLKLAVATGRPWFQNPRHEFQYSEFVFVTPEMAKELLQHNNNTRRCTPSLAQAYARDIQNDHWIPSAESIGINIYGQMYDGQHRAEGITIAEKGMPIYVTFNVPYEAAFVADSGKKRNVNEKLAILFGGTAKMQTKMPAICRAMMAGTGTRLKWTESEIADFALTHEQTLRWVLENLPKQRSDVQAVIGKAYLWYGPEAIQDFCHSLTNLEFKAGTPVSILYMWLNKIGTETSGEVVYRKALKAVEYHVEKTPFQRLNEAKEDLFEWGPNWTVPQRP
jgi:hypothetical protein